MAYKKEQIKDQMIRTAARLWGVPDNEVETNFDPLILLMMEACAAELEKIGYDISTSHSRLLERLAGLVIPESVLGPQPASCVMQAQPSEIQAVITPLNGFYISQAVKLQGATANTDLHFSPIGNFTLHKATLGHVYAGSKLFKVGEVGSKTLLHAGDTKSGSNEIWLAINIDPNLQTLAGLHLYFDLRSHSEATEFYHSLANASAWLNGQPISLGKGYMNNGQFEPDPEEMLEDGYDYTKKINRQVAFVYKDRFLHLGDSVQPLAGAVPQKWAASLPDNLVKAVAKGEVAYLQIQLPRSFGQDVLDGLACSINSFPVINRKFNSTLHRTDEWINIVPLKVEGAFLDLDNVATSTGTPYKFRASAAGRQDLHEGEAMVRSSGVGKTSSREVREMTGRLTEAIRDQSAYFAEVSNEFILSRLREINQMLARLEDHLAGAKDLHDVKNYLLLRPKKPGEMVNITYWTTMGTAAHVVKAGTSLSAYNHTLVVPTGTYTVSNVTGGKDGLAESDKKNLLRQQLVSRGKIVSAGDVKLLCMQVFGNRLKKAEVKKGVQVGGSRSEGFSRTIDVHLSFNKTGSETEAAELAHLCREVEYHLDANASPVYPFRLVID